MANKIITSFFTNLGVPQTGLTPTIDVWQLDNSNPLLNTLVVNNGALIEIGGGLYRYDFSTYVHSNSYFFIVDGGAALPISERYNIAGNESYREEVSTGVWEETAVLHVAPGTMGFLQNQISADVTQVRIDVTTALSLLQTLLKYERNRTKLDKVAKTLTVYDNDGTTPLKVFDLKDSTGAPSILEVCERVPQP